MEPGYIAIGIAAVGWFLAYATIRNDQEKQRTILAKQQADFELKVCERLTELETKTKPIWDMIREKITEILKSPNHKEKDILIIKLHDRTSTREELYELKNIILHEMEEKSRNGHRDITGHGLILALINHDILDAEKQVAQGAR